MTMRYTNRRILYFTYFAVDVSFVTYLLTYLLEVWRSGSVVRRMNEVALRWARLVLGWVTVFGRVYHLGM